MRIPRGPKQYDLTHYKAMWCLPPLMELPSENQRIISEFEFSITIDKKGNFTGVTKDEKK